MKKILFIVSLMFSSIDMFAMENTDQNFNFEQNQAFAKALISEDFDQAKKLIKLGVDVNNTVVGKTTPLIFVVSAGNYDLVDTLIDANVDVNAEDNEHRTALSVAVDLNNVEMVQLLVKQGGADIYQNRVFDRVMNRSEDSEVELSSKYIGPSLKEYFQARHTGDFIRAIRDNDMEAIQNRAAWIDVNMKDEFGYTPLMHAAMRGNVEIIDLLREKGARSNIITESGDNALFFAVRCGQTEALERMLEVSAYDVYNAIINKLGGRKLISRNIYKAAFGRLFKVQSALKHRDGLGYTLLISALNNNREDTALWLIDHGADVNDTCDVDGYEASPLMIASEFAQQRAISKLLEKGANINFKNERGTALDYVLRSDEEIGRTSQNQSAEELKEATKQLLDQTARKLIDQGITISDKEKVFWSVFEKGYMETANSLVNSEFQNDEGETILRVAVKRDDMKFADSLIEKGANVDDTYTYTERKRDETIIYTESLLTWAVRKGKFESVKWLIDHGADLNLRSKTKHVSNIFHDSFYIKKETPLSTAQRIGNFRIANFLRDCYYEDAVRMIRNGEIRAEEI